MRDGGHFSIWRWSSSRNRLKAMVLGTRCLGWAIAAPTRSSKWRSRVVSDTLTHGAAGSPACTRDAPRPPRRHVGAGRPRSGISGPGSLYKGTAFPARDLRCFALPLFGLRPVPQYLPVVRVVRSLSRGGPYGPTPRAGGLCTIAQGAAVVGGTRCLGWAIAAPARPRPSAWRDNRAMPPRPGDSCPGFVARPTDADGLQPPAASHARPRDADIDGATVLPSQ